MTHFSEENWCKSKKKTFFPTQRKFTALPKKYFLLNGTKLHTFKQLQFNEHKFPLNFEKNDTTKHVHFSRNKKYFKPNLKA